MVTVFPPVRRKKKIEEAGNEASKRSGGYFEIELKRKGKGEGEGEVEGGREEEKEGRGSLATFRFALIFLRPLGLRREHASPTHESTPADISYS